MDEKHNHQRCRTEAAETAAAAREARSLLSNLWAHDVEHRLKMRRKSEAMAMGLGDMDVGTYPSHPASNTVVNNNGGLRKGALLAARLLGMGGLGGAGLQIIANGEKTAENNVVQTPGPPGENTSPKPPAEVFGKVTPITFDLLIESVDGDIKATVEP